MKTAIIFLLLSFIVTTAYSQVSSAPVLIPDTASHTKEYYLKKSESQRAVGRTLIIGGAVLLAVGFGASVSAGLDGTGDNGFSGLLLGGSLVSFLGGIAYAVSAKSNREKALSATVGHVRYPQSLHGALPTQSAPTLGLKITF